MLIGLLVIMGCAVIGISFYTFIVQREERKDNAKFRKNAKRHEATLVAPEEEENSTNNLNVGIVQLTDGKKEKMACIFARAATKKNYPNHFIVYVDDKQKCLSADYLQKSCYEPLGILVAGFGGIINLTIIFLCTGLIC